MIKQEKSKRKSSQIRVKFCPKCEDTRIAPLAAGVMGIYQCLNCRFSSPIFPEKIIDIKKLKKKKNARKE